VRWPWGVWLVAGSPVEGVRRGVAHAESRTRLIEEGNTLRAAEVLGSPVLAETECCRRAQMEATTWRASKGGTVSLGWGVRGTAGRRSPSGHAGGFRGSPGLRRMRRAPRDRTHSSSVPSTCHWRESQPHWPENRIGKATPPGRCDTLYRISPSVLTSTQTTCGHTGYASCGATDSRWAPP
jgi:hypothetical protein